MAIPDSLLAILPPYAIVRPHPNSAALFLLTRAFVQQAKNPRTGNATIEFPTETRIIDAAGTDMGEWDGASPWVVRQVTPELLAQTVTMTLLSGPITIPLGAIYLGLATIFRQWWDEDRTKETVI